MNTLFDIPTAGIFNSSYLAEVVSVRDPDRRSRVQVRLYNFDGVEGHDAPIWARVAVPFAGNDCGAFLLPNVGAEVLVSFVHGDPRLPVVVGSLWNGSASAPESLPGDQVDRWTLVGKAGTRIAIVEERSGEATISFETADGVFGVLTDTGGGTIEFEAAGTTITIDSEGVAVQTSADVNVTAAKVSITASEGLNITADNTVFSGAITCQMVQTSTTVSSTYTPGAGGMW